MLRNRGSHRISILLNAAFAGTIGSIKQDFAGLLPESEFVTFAIPSPVEGLVVGNAFRRQAAELIREWAIHAVAPDVVILTSLFEGAVDEGVTSIGRFGDDIPAATIHHDLIPYAEPAVYLADPTTNAWFHDKLESLKRSALLLANSEHSAKQAVELVGISPGRVQTIYAAADERFRPRMLSEEPAAELAERIGLKRKFIMNTSTFEPRKNFEGLLRGFARLPKALRHNYQLVFAAQISEDNRVRVGELAASLGLDPDELVIAGHVSDRELIHLYSTCELFVFPSFSEGFGLPALEAMSCGAVVIGSNTTSIPEVIGRRDALFDPRSDADIAQSIERALTDLVYRNGLKAFQVQHAKGFSWERSAKLALEALESKVGSRQKPPGEISASSLMDAIASLPSLPAATLGDLAEIAADVARTERSLSKWRASAPSVRSDAPAAPKQGNGAGGIAALPRLPEAPRVRPELPSIGPQPSILLLKLDHIGDFIISIDAFRIIRETWPKAHITLVCGPWNKGLAERTRLFDRIVPCHFFTEAGADYSREALAEQGLNAYLALGLGEYDIAVDLRYYGDSRILLHHTKAKVRAGYVGDGVELDLSLPEIPETEMKLHVGARAVALASAVAWTFGPSAQAGRSAQGSN